MNDRFNKPVPSGIFKNCFVSIDGTFCPRQRPSEDEIRQNLTSGLHHTYGWLYLLMTRNTDGFFVGFWSIWCCRQ